MIKSRSITWWCDNKTVKNRVTTIFAADIEPSMDIDKYVSTLLIHRLRFMCTAEFSLAKYYDV